MRLFISTFFILILSIGKAVAQTNEAANTIFGLNQTELLLVAVAGLLLLIVILLLAVAVAIRKVIQVVVDERKTEEQLVAELKAKEAKPTFWQRINGKLTDSVPVEKEEDIMLDHEYDGIRELDNHLPPWWKWLFYFTIGWSAVYLLVFHVFGFFPLSETEYEIAMVKAEEQRAEFMAQMEANIDETNVEFTLDEAHLQNGKKIFDSQCATCHGTMGEGKAGPNLTDNYWLHGGSIDKLFSTVKYGVPQTAMISWERKLTPLDMRDVSSFILTLVGTNPPNPKKPEGEFFNPNSDETSEESAETPSDTVSTSNDIISAENMEEEDSVVTSM